MGQQVAQLHERYMMMMIIYIICLFPCQHPHLFSAVCELLKKHN